MTPEPELHAPVQTTSRIDITFLDLPSVIQNLAMNNRTGVLKVTSGNQLRGIRFQDGQIRMVVDPARHVSAEFLADALIRTRQLERSQWKALAPELDRHQPLGPQLLARGTISDDQLGQAYGFYVTEAVCDVFTWSDLECEFIHGEPPAEWTGGDLDSPIVLNANSILFEATRRSDELVAIRHQLPSLADVPVRSEGADPEAESDASRAEILTLCNGLRDIDDVIGLARMGRFDATKLLNDMVLDGTIQLRDLQGLLEVAKFVKEQAKHLTDAQKTEKLVRLYERTEDLGHSNPQLDFWLARAYERAQRTADAVERYVKISARLLVDRVQLADAIKLLRRAIDLDPEHIDARMMLIDGYMAVGQKDKAVSLVGGIVADMRSRGATKDALGFAQSMRSSVGAAPEMVRQIAEMALEAGDKIQAIIEFEELALLYTQSQDYKLAIDTYKRIITLDEQNINAHYLLAQTLQKAGQVDEAVRRYKQLADNLSSSDLGGSINWQFLIRIYESIAEIEPENVIAREWLSDAYITRNESEKALGHLRSLVELLGGDPDRPEAKSALLKLIGLAPDDLEARRMLAELLVARGDSQEGLAEYLKLAELALDREKLPIARFALVAALGVDPLRLGIHEGLARYYTAHGDAALAASKERDVCQLKRIAGDLAGATEALQRACAVDARYTAGLFELARAYALADQPRPAAQLLKAFADHALSRRDLGSADQACELARSLTGVDVSWVDELRARLYS